MTVRDYFYAVLGEGRDRLEISSTSAARVYLDGGYDYYAWKSQLTDTLLMARNRLGTSGASPIYRNWERIGQF